MLQFISSSQCAKVLWIWRPSGVPGYHQEVYMGLIIVIAMLIQFSAGALKR